MRIKLVVNGRCVSTSETINDGQNDFSDICESQGDVINAMEKLYDTRSNDVESIELVRVPDSEVKTKKANLIVKYGDKTYCAETFDFHSAREIILAALDDFEVGAKALSVELSDVVDPQYKVSATKRG
jgi:hypothetical protein